ncbi:MAG: Hpt domain-containing protein [Phascolarctobacterium sp.]
MSIKDCYDKMGADYENIYSRLGDADMIEYLVLKFTRDTNMQKLIDALARQDYEAGFMAVHTLKGVVLNLGLTQLEPSVVAITEEMRGGKAPKSLALLESMKDIYARTMMILEDYRANK